MNKILLLSFLLLLFTNLFSQTNKKIELFDLMKMFAPELDNQYKDWGTGTKRNHPIVWETIGNEFVDEKDFNQMLGFYVRKGKVAIPLNMNKLAKTKEITEWEIRVYGSRIEIFNLYLTNDLLSHNNCFENECVESYFVKKGAKIKLLCCDDENLLTYGKRFYEIVIKKKPKIFLTVDFSCGSAGCGGNFIFHFNYPDKEYFIKQELTNTLCK